MVGDNEALSDRVVQAAATARSTDPLELPPLYDAIDPDALGTIVDGMADGEVVFSYGGCEITVTADGAVSVGGCAGGCGSVEPLSASD